MDWIFPRYRRLPMGSGHSVHILMTMITESVGRTLVRSLRLGPLGDDVPDPPEKATDGITYCDLADDDGEEILPADEDRLWAEAHFAKRLREPSTAWDKSRPATLTEFREAARRARMAVERVFVVMHAFSGARRENDFEHHLRIKCQELEINLLVISVDLGIDVHWDLGAPETFAEIHQMIEEGLLDGLLGGPPCATWTRLRFRHGGPRPLRFRWCPWGRSDLTAHEHDRLVEVNTLAVNYLSLCEALALRGGIYALEHPEDPGEDPFPSLFNTDLLKSMEARAGGKHTGLDQCALGGPTQKPTGISNNIEALPARGPRCPGNHRHGKSTGKCSDGTYRSQRLSAFPSEMCEWLASAFARLLQRSRCG